MPAIKDLAASAALVFGWYEAPQTNVQVNEFRITHEQLERIRALRDDWLWPDRGGSGRGVSQSDRTRSKDEPESVRYEQINAMLLNEFLKERRKVEQLTKDFESMTAEQQGQIDALHVVNLRS